MAATVYRVDIDVARYASFTFGGTDDEYAQWSEQLVRFDGTPKAEAWRPIPIELSDDPSELGDLAHGFIGFGSFGVTNAASTELRNLMGRSGELLPTSLPSIDIVNITTVVDCLDEAVSSRNRMGLIDRFLFRVDQLPKGPELFKLPPSVSYHSVLCIDNGSSGSLLDIDRSQRIRGLKLFKLWDQEAGPEPDPNRFPG